MNRKQRLVWAFLNPILISIIVFWIFMRPFNRSSFTRGNIFLFIALAIGIYIWRNIKYWSMPIKKRIRLIAWVVFVVFMGLIIYVNYYMPHGEMIDTGYEIDPPEWSRGGPVEKYVEDMRELNIPGWAKFLRANTTAIFLIGIFVAGSITDLIKREESNDE